MFHLKVAWLEINRGAFQTSRGIRAHPQSVAGMVLLATIVAAVAMTSRTDGQFGVFAALGLGMGVVLQRSRFCFNSAFRDLLQFRSGRTMKGVIVGMTVAALGFGLHMYVLMPNPFLGSIAPDAHAVPLSAALLIGGVMFGVGMVLAGGCTSGSLYRMGEGYVASWVAFAGILTGLLLVGHSWNWWWQHIIRPAPLIWFPHVLGYGGAVLLTLVLLLGAYVLVLWVESTGGPGVVEAAPAVSPTSFRGHLQALASTVFGRGWPASIGGAVLGGLNVLAYTAHMPWRIVGELSRWANGAAGIVGWAPGPLQGTDELSGCTLTVGGGLLTHGLLLNVGLVAGSLLAALLAHEFKVRVPRNPIRYAQSVGGGLLMGYGAGIALGCTVGAFFSAIPSLALNGWVFALALTGGAFFGLKLIDRIP